MSKQGISPIAKGATPLMLFSFATDDDEIIVIPNNPTSYTVMIHDSAGIREGGGTISTINTTAGTCQYQAVATDTANAGVVVWWILVDLGEPMPRPFDPQKILIEDLTQVG